MISKKSFLKAVLPIAITAGVAISSQASAGVKFDKASLSYSHVPNELLVIYKDSADMSGAISSLRGLGAVEASVLGKSADSALSRTVQIEMQGSLLEAMKLIALDPSVAYVEPNFILSADGIPNDPLFSELWGLNNTGQTGGTRDADIDAAQAWGIEKGDSSVVVGVIDTGVAYDHPDLAANMWVNTGEIADNGVDDDSNGYVDDIHGINCITDSGDPYDDQGHGTHVAGTVAALSNNGKGVAGVAPKASIMALKFLSAEGSGSTSDAAQCLEYAIDMGASLTNNSWGGGPPSLTMRNAIIDAAAAGQLFVAAAGNSGTDNDSFPHYPSNYNISNVFSVANTTHTDELAESSSYGATTVDIAAPGSDILSTVPYKVTAQIAFYSGEKVKGLAVVNAAEGIADGFVADGGLCTEVLTGVEGKVVMCERGEISFFDKVSNAETGGAIGVVIYNNEPGGLGATLGDGNSSTIPAITVTQEEGAYILANYLSKRGRIKSENDENGLGYDSYTGTSMAAPHVAGGAALLLSIDPTLTPTDLKTILMDTVDEKESLDGKVLSNGRMNIKEALKSMP